jgi:hypothetical protein
VDYSRPTTADASGVSSRDEFATFLERVLTDYRTSGRDEWENTTLESVPDARGALAAARVAHPDNPEDPTWQLIAAMLVAPTAYE